MEHKRYQSVDTGQHDVKRVHLYSLYSCDDARSVQVYTRTSRTTCDKHIVRVHLTFEHAFDWTFAHWKITSLL